MSEFIEVSNENGEKYLIRKSTVYLVLERNYEGEFTFSDICVHNGDEVENIEVEQTLEQILTLLTTVTV